MDPKDAPAWIEALRPFSQINKVLVAHLLSIVASTEEAALRIIRLLHALEQEVGTLSGGLRGGDSVGRLVQETLAEVQFQDITRQRIELVVRVLGQLDQQVARLIEHGEHPERVQIGDCQLDLDGISKQYVMHSQRVDHAAAGGKGDGTEVCAACPLDIELF